MITPGPMKGKSKEGLMEIIRTEGRPGFGLPQQAIDELWYRFIVKSEELLERNETATLALEKASTRTYQEVAILASSSGKLEELTIKLKNLTWALLLLTIFAIAVPIGIEVWKAYHAYRTAPAITLPQP